MPKKILDEFFCLSFILLAILLLPLELLHLLLVLASAVVYSLLRHLPYQNKSKQHPRKTQAHPTLPASLGGKCWQADMQLMLSQTVPSTANERTVRTLADTVRAELSAILLDVEVSGFVSSQLGCSRAFRVAVPDIELVFSISLETLTKMQGYLGTRQCDTQTSRRQLEKCAIRFISATLVNRGFKFRRSAFTREEPKITLMAPSKLSSTREALPVDILVNAVMPSRYAAILAECGQINSHAKELIILVRRWAKDRAICCEAKGFLSPYQWSFLVIYFLQVRKDGALLPPLAQFRAFGNPKARACDPSGSASAALAGREVSTARLFKDVMRFYDDFNWSEEMVSCFLGCRQNMPAFSRTFLRGPYIQDPFRPSSNLAAQCTADGFRRVKTELRRCHELCSRGGSVQEVFELWSPQEHDE